MSSRLVRTRSGRPAYVEITMPEVGLEQGVRFAVLGNECHTDGFGFTGAPTGRPPLPAEASAKRDGGVARGSGHQREWSDQHRQQARQLQAEGLSQSQIAAVVCGDKKFRSTIQLWLRASAPVAPPVNVSETTPGPHRQSI